MPKNDHIPGYHTRAQAADLLGVSRQRVSAIARRDDWASYRVGRSLLYDAEDVGRTRTKKQAQKAWAVLGIPRREWGAWWLADVDEVGVLECPACGGVAYTPAGDTKWSDSAACPACGWKK